jgi:mannose-6-phosphate isomerase-like protein (cupin superfamily)
MRRNVESEPIGAFLKDARSAPNSPGRQSALLLERGTLEVRYYAPKGIDAQTPHDRDEAYVVISGSGDYRLGSRTVPFGPGDLLFAPAGAEHRFERFTDDFATWVLFYGPTGGELPERP